MPARCRPPLTIALLAWGSLHCGGAGEVPATRDTARVASGAGVAAETPPSTPPAGSWPVRTAAAQTHYVAALELEARGKGDEALHEVELSIAEGGTRDAYMLGARLAIAAGRLNAATAWTDAILAHDPKDADALYNRGLLAHKGDDYNTARTAYLATLEQRPDYADARYNLVLLTWASGAQDEARHHRARFEAQHPGDPRNASLTQMLDPTARK